ncbi:MAG: ferredoxin-nitrite/sulfite reductase [Cenarchaeum symbiont of Oopsacas minuta]|nr:ferredoxin-nitrite/sulfite reductase [Cenarchaeum symbiont of Oopsacas minuta]
MPIEGRTPKIDWARTEEAVDFAKTVKLFRQKKYDEDSFRRYRLQHGAYGTRMTGDYAMVRVKIPGGRIYPNQLENLANLSESFSIGSAHFSTRENVQLHWVVLEDVSEILRELGTVGLTSREACGNSVRNVMCSPLSGVCPDEEFDATPYALATAKFFLRNPMAQTLPRKFKFNFTCCEKHGMVRIVDVGALPCIKVIDGERRRGFRIFLGGGLGNRSFIGHQLEDFTLEEDFLYTAIATVQIFDRLGNRKNLARNRLRYLVHEMGWEKFRNLVLKERAIVRATQSATIKLDLDMNDEEIRRPLTVSDDVPGNIPQGYDRWLQTNTMEQIQSGYHSVFISLEAGDITANQLRATAMMVQDYSHEGVARMGFSQNIVLRYVHADDLRTLYSTLVDSGLAKPGGLTMAATVGCSGTTSCNLALTNSHRLAKEIQRKLLELKMDEDPQLVDSTIKISGCPNSCGQHGIATIGFFGGGSRVGKDMYPIYQMSLGGRFDGRATLGEHCMRIPARRVIDAIIKIISIFKENSQGESDTLKSWLQRIIEGNENSTRSISDIKKLLEPLTIPPAKSDDSEFYTDYGTDDSYHAKTGKGECAA